MSSQVRDRRGWSVALVAMVAGGLSCFAPVADSQMLDPALLEQYTQLELRMATAIDALADARGDICPNTCPSGEITTLYNNIVFPLLSIAADAGGSGSQDLQTLKHGLRQLGPEEMFALGPIAAGFGQGQLNTLEGRIGAIRSLSRARLFARNVVSDRLKYGYAAADGVPVGAAGAGFSRLNYFLDTSVGFGDRSDTTGFDGIDPLDTGIEDAFDFDSNELTLGVDWRFSDNLVAGGLLGYSDRKLRFDPDESFAQGHINGNGLSLIGFAQWDEMRWYGSFGLGFQQLGFKTLRRVPLGSAADDPPPDVVGAAGKPDSTALLASLNAGLPFQKGSWGADLFFNAAFQQQSINAFTERQVDDGGAVETTGFLFHVGKQNIRSFDTSLGVKLQYVATPSFGVLVPFVRAAYHRELESSRHKLKLQFAGLEGLDEATQEAIEEAFQVPLASDRPDQSWISLSAGASAVIRGSNRVNAAGRGSGGLQAYLQYTTNVGLAHYNSDAISAGLRYEF